MKTNFLLVAMLLVVFSMITLNANAQQNLNELTKKLETMDNVDMNSVQQRDPQTKKMNQLIKNYTVYSKVLVDEIINAFAQDKKDAHTVIEDKKGGKVKSLFYRFMEGNKEITYSFSTVEDDVSEAAFTLIENYDR